MEFWDILDVTGNKTGRTIWRGQAFQAGEYHLVVHVHIINKQGEFLIQKRSLTKAVLPGVWDITSGAVLSGEDSLAGAIRETEEELGISLCPEKFLMITRLKRKNNFVDIWAAFSDVSLDDVVMQVGEVDEVKFVNADDMMNIIFSPEYPKYREYIYKQAMLEVLRNINLPHMQ
ncbi:NUDIX hydrolase [Sporomusa sp.]|uniref:NUDIX hydrolase n=1 Tax=Sporomusa sp. TaxID=2078658 RepID=UPI002C3D9184|nr:NUDIX domain-containing protein [Sporomusa sp.]HWR09307.1 NUDIX domain-containing protein [Sporomusa sp.]